MKWLLQAMLLNIYKLLLRSGFLSTKVGRQLLNYGYDIYKVRIEASYVTVLEQFVPQGSLVIDVGANTGFFTRYFAEWVQETGRVIAIEPDPDNYRQLQANLEKSGLSAYVDTVCAAVSAENGYAKLLHDIDNPANHKLGTSGIAVKTITIDSLVDQQALPVSFIKIDVQGAEMLVLQGAKNTLTTHHPNLIVEIHEPSLADFDVKPEDVLQLLMSYGYDFHIIANEKLSGNLDIHDILNSKESYVDVICLWQN